MANYLAQIIVSGTQILVRAFAKALRQELRTSQEAAQRLGDRKAARGYVDNTKMGITIEEAKQILNIDELIKEDIVKRYEFLHKMNEKSNGGSFYLQSKVVRAKQRLEKELQNTNEDTHKT